MKKIERIAALEAQLTKALTALSVLEARVAMLESRQWKLEPAVSPYRLDTTAPPWTVTYGAEQ